MDYVLFGLGFGASLMLIGWALRTFGPGLRYSYDDESATDDQYDVKQRWIQFTNGLGAVLGIGGLAIVLVTVIMQLLKVANRIGDWVVLGLAIATAIGALVWAWMFAQNVGLNGIARRRGDLEVDGSAAPLYDDSDDEYRPRVDEDETDEDEDEIVDVDDEFDFGPIPDDSVDERLARRAAQQDADEESGAEDVSADDETVAVEAVGDDAADVTSDEVEEATDTETSDAASSADAVDVAVPADGETVTISAAVDDALAVSTKDATDTSDDDVSEAYRALVERWDASSSESVADSGDAGETTTDTVIADETLTVADTTSTAVGEPSASEDETPAADLSEGIFADDVDAPVASDSSETSVLPQATVDPRSREAALARIRQRRQREQSGE